MVHTIAFALLLFGFLAKADYSDDYYPDSESYGCMESLGLSDAMRTEFLDAHNNLRSSIELGLYKLKKGGKLGPARNMNELEWDCKLEEIAKKSIDACSTKTSTDTPRNVISLKEQKGPTPELANVYSSMSKWRNQARKYGLLNNNTIGDPKVAEFANMAYANTTKVGCSFKRCEENFITACAYDKDGSRLGTVLWERACKTNADCTPTSDFTCKNGVCVEQVKRIPEDTCKLNNGMTDDERNAVVIEHNKLRSLVAKGLARNPNGTNNRTEKAARMLKMVYDCKIEENASKYAKKCAFRHSSYEERPELGESLWLITGQRRNFTQMLVWASNSWYRELQTVGVPPDNRLTWKLWSYPEPIGHYTQIVWDTTYKLGCGVQLCKGMTMVVCQYSPPGNVLGRLIYAVGEPCQTDSDCQCDGCKCSREEALCIKSSDVILNA